MTLLTIFCLKLAVFFIISTLTNGANIMGIDLGSDFMKVASVRPGTPFHIVVDEMSKRKMTTVVGFDVDQRLFGNHAKTTSVRKSDRVFKNMIRLLGKTIDCPEAKEILEFGYPYKFVELENRRHAIGVQYGDTIYSPEELVGMILEYIRKIAKDDAKSDVQECVLTVPDYWTQQERIALLDAAEIAGLNVLSLVNENTAAAVQYGIDRKYNVTDDPHLVIFYNMGGSATTASLVTYTAYLKKVSRKENRTIGQLDVKAKSYDKHLGGQHFTDAIVKYLIEAAENKFKGLVVANEKRVYAKLRAEAEKTKIVLSANKARTVYVESLYNDQDFKVDITRKQFYKLATNLIARSTDPLKDLLAQKKLKPEQIDSIVIIGGNSRIPAIKEAIKDFMNVNELGLSLNGDEAMALGSVFRAANLSVSFQVRKLGMSDISMYSIAIKVSDIPTVSIPVEEEEEIEKEETENDEQKDTEKKSDVEKEKDVEQEKDVDQEKKVDQEKDETQKEVEQEKKEEQKEVEQEKEVEKEEEAEVEEYSPPLEPFEPFNKKATLFKRNNKLSKRKTVAFNHTRDFLCQIFHDKPDQLPVGLSADLVNYNVTGITALMYDRKNEHLMTFENKTQKPRVSLYFSLDSSGIVRLASAEAVLYGMVEEKIRKKVKKPVNRTTADLKKNETDLKQNETEQNGTVQNGTIEEDSKEKDQEDQVEDDQEKSATDKEAENQETNVDDKEAADQGKEADDKEAEDQGKKEGDKETEDQGKEANDTEGEDQEKNANKTEEKTKKKKKKKKTVEMEEVVEIEYKWKRKKYTFPLKLKKLSVLSTIKGVTSRQLRRSRKVLAELKEFDELRQRIALAKNDLESYIYSTRGNLDDETVALVSTEESRQQLSTMLMDSEDWLYDQLDDSESPFLEKLDELRAISDPIFSRAYEYGARPQVVDKAKELLNYTQNMLIAFAEERPWIPKEDTTKLKEKVDYLNEWIANKTAEQETKELIDEPAFYSNALLKKLKPISKLADEMVRFPKPKDKPKSKKSKKSKSKNSTATNSTTNSTANNTVNVNNTTSDDVNQTSSNGKDEATSEESKAEAKPKIILEELTPDESPDDSTEDAEASGHKEL